MRLLLFRGLILCCTVGPSASISFPLLGCPFPMAPPFVVCAWAPCQGEMAQCLTGAKHVYSVALGHGLVGRCDLSSFPLMGYFQWLAGQAISVCLGVLFAIQIALLRLLFRQSGFHKSPPWQVLLYAFPAGTHHRALAPGLHCFCFTCFALGRCTD